LAGHELHVRILEADFFAFRGSDEWLDLWASFPSLDKPAAFRRSAKLFRAILPTQLQVVFDTEVAKVVATCSGAKILKKT
jgi:hypothetical protein